MQGYTVELLKYEGERAAEVNPVKVLGADLATEPVQIAGPGGKLGGSLTRPRGVAGRLPGVVFLSDSGKHDREGNANNGAINIGTREILDEATKAGFAVLRVDDRGVGESEGDYSRTTMSSQTADAGAMIDFLKQRPDIDPTRLALLGQGEGANVAIMVAAQRADLKAIVLMAPCDVSLAQLAEEQVKHRMQLDGETDPAAWQRAPVAILLRMAREKPDLKSTVIAGHQVWLEPYRQWAAMQPVEDLKQTAAKILHVQAGRDLQVFPRHAEGFRRAMSGEKRYTFKSFDNLNHFFQPSKGTIGEYADPTARVEAGFLAYLTDWLKANL
jgi:dienelactone hydrolase